MLLRFTIYVLILTASQNVFAQFENTNFEEWEIINGSNFPKDWNIIGSNCEPNSTIFQIENSYEGDYALMLTAGCVFLDTYASQSIIQTYELMPNEELVNLSFYFKHQNIQYNNQDSIGCAYLHIKAKQENQQEQSEWWFRESQEEITQWTKVEINLSELIGVNQLTAEIFGGSCPTGSSSNGNSEFIIDAFVLETKLNSSIQKYSNKFNYILSPNPATEYLNIPISEDGTIRISSILGESIITKEYTIGKEAKVEIRELPIGNYIFQQFNEKGQSIYNSMFYKL